MVLPLYSAMESFGYMAAHAFYSSLAQLDLCEAVHTQPALALHVHPEQE